MQKGTMGIGYFEEFSLEGRKSRDESEYGSAIYTMDLKMPRDKYDEFSLDMRNLFGKKWTRQGEFTLEFKEELETVLAKYQ